MFIVPIKQIIRLHCEARVFVIGVLIRKSRDVAFVVLIWTLCW